MKLYCVRHGQAENLPDASGDRPLTPEGKMEIEKVALYLEKRGVTVSHLMHSSKLRAQQTAEYFAKSLLSDHNQSEVSKLLEPDASVTVLVSHIQTWNEDTMLVGHMPFVSELVSRLLVGNQSFDLVCFTPGTVVCLEQIEGGQWILSWILRPELIAPWLSFS